MLRNKNIDNLRGISILGMFVVHSASYFRNEKLIFLIWDFFEWVVPGFIFCSFYLLINKKNNLFQRFKRIVLPYYFSLLFFLPLFYFFQKWRFKNFDFILKNLFFLGGFDFNWLPLLFIYLNLFWFLLKRINNKFFYWFWFFVSLFFSLYFIINPLPYRGFMWLSWILIIYFVDFFKKIEKEKFKKNVFIFSLWIIFLILNFYEKKINHNLSQFANKYPPTLYHLSFGLFWSLIFYEISKINFFSFLKLEKILYFFSVNSYSLFFIHFFIIEFLVLSKFLSYLNFFSLFLIILFFSVIFQLLINKLKNSFIFLKA